MRDSFHSIRELRHVGKELLLKMTTRILEIRTSHRGTDKTSFRSQGKFYKEGS